MIDRKYLVKTVILAAKCLTWFLFFLNTPCKSLAQNPFIRDQFTADPSAHVFGDRLYVYPSHDIVAREGKGKIGWFCMEDYHVFSSANLTDWTDHGVILHQNNVPWVKKNSYNMWAPDCIYKNGKYYFYFPATPQDTSHGAAFNIGVAIGQQPAGPFIPNPEAIKGVNGIDPNVFIDKDGSTYLFWSRGDIYGTRLKDNMTELATPPKILAALPEKGLKEGPFLFERNGTYYLTYPHVENKIERLEYAIADNPLGPFKVQGVLMHESDSGCWTNHQSIVQFKNQWYLFYHHNDYSPRFDKNRSIRADSLFFNTDGSIRPVKPTWRGVGVSDARQKIHVDRFTAISDQGVSIEFLDTLHPFDGWKLIYTTPGAWSQYNAVDLGKKPYKTAKARVTSSQGGILEVRAGSLTGKVLAEIKIPASKEFNTIQIPTAAWLPGTNNLFFIWKGPGHAEVDWISFE